MIANPMPSAKNVYPTAYLAGGERQEQLVVLDQTILGTGEQNDDDS